MVGVVLLVLVVLVTEVKYSQFLVLRLTKTGVWQKGDESKKGDNSAVIIAITVTATLKTTGK